MQQKMMERGASSAFTSSACIRRVLLGEKDRGSTSRVREVAVTGSSLYENSLFPSDGK